MGQPVAASALAGRVTIRHRGRSVSSWPFKNGAPEPAAVSEFGVGVPRRQEVEFADGSRLWLHRVDRNGVPDLFLRELGAPATGMLIDLRHLVPELGEDLPKAATRDLPGTVHFSLRVAFSSVDELLQVAVALGSPE